jgi:SAM-dependent methyltransferase
MAVVLGGFLEALGNAGFMPCGVEFDRDAALCAGTNANCRSMSVEDFWEQTEKQLFDAIHFGDVLEHLPYPEDTLRKLLAQLKPGGVLFVEGPLEINPSPVYWSAKIFGVLKHLLRPNFVAADPPTHLFRTGGRQQLQFFSRVDPNLQLKVWSVYETGWPYANGSPIKRLIARLAKSIGGKKMFGESFGNRFRGVFVN